MPTLRTQYDFHPSEAIKTPQELEKRISKYFNDCSKDDSPLTKTGLAIAIGVGRSTLARYRDREEFREIMLRASAICERYAEESLFTNKNVAGVIFNLKNNYGWEDKHETKYTGGLGMLLQEIQDTSRSTVKLAKGGLVEVPTKVLDKGIPDKVNIEGSRYATAKVETE